MSKNNQALLGKGAFDPKKYAKDSISEEEVL